MNTECRVAKPSLTDELQRYEIGAKLRSLRLKKKLGLVELGRHTGLSPALLSKLERGKMFPTLPTLLRIAMVFSVDLDYFFADHRKHRALAIVRRAARQRFPEAPGRRDPAYHFESLTFPVAEPKCEAYVATFHPVAEGKARPHEHAGRGADLRALRRVGRHRGSHRADARERRRDVLRRLGAAQLPPDRPDDLFRLDRVGRLTP